MRKNVLPSSVFSLLLAVHAGAAAQTAPVYGYTFTPPGPATGTPRILKVELNSDRLDAGGPIAMRVTTTTDVVKVVTGSGKRQGTLDRAADGVFTAASNLPHLGGITAIKIKLSFTATTAAGATTSVEVPVTYK